MKYVILVLIAMISGCVYDAGSEASYEGNSGSYPNDYEQNNETGDQYIESIENGFILTSVEPKSTFSIDADGAAYANVRRFIQQEGVLPPKGAIRTEEFLNYFNLDYDEVQSSHPISLNGEISDSPWGSETKLVRIGVKGRSIAKSDLPISNFVLLIDVSGSMGSEDKLDLLKNGFKYFVDQMSDKDKIAIVTYAGSAKLILESTNGNEKQKIKNAIDALGSNGGTAGAEGILTAYEIIKENFVVGGNNRVVIGTDGDFNVGPSSHSDLIKLIEEKREEKVFVTVLGVGRGNLNEGMLEQIANNGNGNYEYLDNVEQLKKVFVSDYNKFYTVAKDVKIQVDFNALNVEAYRLIGYENRVLNNEDFEDDKKDAGELGSGQSITALYELRMKKDASIESSLIIDVRYKKPDSDESVAMSLDIKDGGNSFENSSGYMKFCAGVAGFSMLLLDSDYKGSTSFPKVLEWLDSSNLKDPNGYKMEFKNLVELASQLK